MDRKYFVYLLVGRIEGVFYVGLGDETRLITTLNKRGNKLKVSKIQEIENRGDKVTQIIIYSSTIKSRCHIVEHALIEYYKTSIVNSSGVDIKYPTPLKINLIEIPNELKKRNKCNKRFRSLQ